MSVLVGKKNLLDSSAPLPAEQLGSQTPPSPPLLLWQGCCVPTADSQLLSPSPPLNPELQKLIYLRNIAFVEMYLRLSRHSSAKPKVLLCIEPHWPRGPPESIYPLVVTSSLSTPTYFSISTENRLVNSCSVLPNLCEPQQGWNDLWRGHIDYFTAASLHVSPICTSATALLWPFASVPVALKPFLSYSTNDRFSLSSLDLQ